MVGTIGGIVALRRHAMRGAARAMRRMAMSPIGRRPPADPGDGSPLSSASMAGTLIDLLDTAVTRYGERPALGLRQDDGSTIQWTFRELDRRARIAAWRLRALDLEPGDRILTWSPSTPALPAAYYGAMHARLVLVPLDLRMSADAVQMIVRASGARHLILGTGRDAPDPREAGLTDFPTTTVDALSAEPVEDDALFPPDWEA